MIKVCRPVGGKEPADFSNSTNGLAKSRHARGDIDLQRTARCQFAAARIARYSRRTISISSSTDVLAASRW